MSTHPVTPVGLALLSVLRILGKLALWLTIAALAFCAAVLLATNFVTGFQFLMFLSMAFGGIAGVMSAWRRQRSLAREVAERPPLPLQRPFRPSRVACVHPTRGAGELVVDQQGDLHFLPEDSGTAKSVAYVGLDLEKVSLWRLVGRRLKTFFCPGFRRKLCRTDRRLFIPRACQRHVLPLARLVMGPTVAVAYELPGERTFRIEDFTLCTVGGNQVRTPTADPNGWACDLGLPEPSLGLRSLVLRRRAAMRRRIALADMGVAVVVSGAIFFAIASTYSIILASERGLAQGAALFGILAGIWALTLLLCAACHLRCER